VSTGLVNALALTALIESGGLTGQVTFGLLDGLSLTSQLVLDTDVIGPWSSGPVQVRLFETKATLTNRTEQKVNVSDLEVGSGPRRGERIAAELALGPGASDEVDVGDQAVDVFAIYEPVPQKLTLEQLNVFVEDVATNVLLVNLVDYGTHGLASLEVTAHLKGVNHDYTVTLADGQSGEIDMTLPLTTYLNDQVLEFRLTKHMRSGEVASIGWLSWDLKSQGTIVSITPQMVE
jgi:hypothetical protein